MLIFDLLMLLFFFSIVKLILFLHFACNIISVIVSLIWLTETTTIRVNKKETIPGSVTYPVTFYVKI